MLFMTVLSRFIAGSKVIGSDCAIAMSAEYK